MGNPARALGCCLHFDQGDACVKRSVAAVTRVLAGAGVIYRTLAAVEGLTAGRRYVQMLLVEM